MEETLIWVMVGLAFLASVALALLNAWLLLKVVLISLTRGTAFRGKADSPLETKHTRD